MEAVDFIKMFLLRNGVDIAVFGFGTYLLRYVMLKWIDRTFGIKEKELDYQYKILEHRAQVTYSSLHLKRAEVIRLLYGKILDFKQSVLEVVNKAHVNDNGGTKRFETFYELGTEINGLVEREGIYLDEPTCALILKVAFHYDQAALTMQVGAGIPINWEVYVPKLERSRKMLTDDCAAALKELQNQFREILGVELSTSSVGTPN